MESTLFTEHSVPRIQQVYDHIVNTDQLKHHRWVEIHPRTHRGQIKEEILIHFDVKVPENETKLEKRDLFLMNYVGTEAHGIIFMVIMLIFYVVTQFVIIRNVVMLKKFS